MTRSIEAFLQEAERDLREAGIDPARYEARYILCHVSGWDLQHIIAYPEREIPERFDQQAKDLIERRKRHEPLAHLCGEKEFWSLTFKVTKDTLIPRADSETLIEAALDLFSERDQRLEILDLGTGSGCLLLSALSEFKQAQGLGIDASLAALAVARENAETLSLLEKCRFQQGNWCQGLHETFDLILANPPYISANEKNLMNKEVLDYEPESALFAAEDGLAAYRIITQDLARVLKPGGFCLFEIGFRQARAVSEILKAHNLKVINIRQDLSGRDRVVISKKTEVF